MCRERWSTFESHGRKTFSERNVCEEGGVSIDCTKTKLEPQAISIRRRESQRNERYQSGG